VIDMNLALAERVARATLSHAAGLGLAMTVSVVDEAGRLVLTLRGDGTGFLTPETSRAKAVAAIAFRRDTRDLAEWRKSNPAFWESVPAISRHEALPSSGAVPVRIGDRVIGAVGCGGGTPEQDHECAAAGAAAVAQG
jgi:uncharacterized protein GlcG (DUF336 family)